MPEQRGGEVSIIIRAKDLTSAVANKVRASIRQFGNVIRDVGRAMAAFTAGAAAMVLGLTKLAQQGGKVNDVKASFARLTGDEARALDRLRQATGGTISDLELMARHNQALAQGAAQSTDEFARMAAAGKALGEAFGMDAAAGMDKLADVMASGSQRAAREIGLEIKAGASRNEILAEAERKMRELAGAENAAADAGDRFATAIANARDRLAAFVATSPLVAGFLDTLANLVTTIVGAIERQDWQLLGDVFQTIGETVGDAFVFGVNKSLEKLTSSAESPLLTIRGLIGWLGGKFFGGNATEAGANLRTDMTTLEQLFARGRAGDASQAIAPVVLPGLDVAVPGGGIPGQYLSPIDLMHQAATAQRMRFLTGQQARYGPDGRLLQREDLPGAAVAPVMTSMTPERTLLANELAREAEEVDKAGQVVVASMGAMAEAAIRGGKLTAESVINMMARILQSLPGVGGFAGALIGAAGGIVGALFGRSRDRDPVRVAVAEYEPAALAQMDKHTGPKHITTTIEVGGVPIETVEADLADRSNRDETVRYSRGRKLTR